MADEMTTGPADESKKETQAPQSVGNSGAPSTQGNAPVSVPGFSDQPLKNDIAELLKEVKLPERTPFKSSADIKPPKTIELSPVLSETRDDAREDTGEHADTKEDNGGTGPVVSVHTLRDDLKHVVRDQKISVIRATALEEEKRGHASDEPIAPTQLRSRLFGVIFATGLLSLLGLAALGGVYITVQSQSAPLPEQQKADSIIFAEQSTAFPIDNASAITLKSKLRQIRDASNASLGSITRIVPLISEVSADGTSHARLATLSEFFSSIGAAPPQDLLRALSDSYFLGLHTVDKNAPLFIIPVTSYSRAFAGMLDWEKTMNDNLAPLFTQLPSLTTGADGIPVQRTFSDMVMRNYDVRVLKDDTGQIQLYYSFPTRDILIIAESPYTFNEILARLQAQRRL